MTTISLAKDVVCTGAAAACVFGPQVFVPVVAGAYGGHAIFNYMSRSFNTQQATYPQNPELSNIKSAAIKAFAYLGSLFAATEIASILGASLTVVQASALVVAAYALRMLVDVWCNYRGSSSGIQVMAY